MRYRGKYKTEELLNALGSDHAEGNLGTASRVKEVCSSKIYASMKRLTPLLKVHHC